MTRTLRFLAAAAVLALSAHDWAQTPANADATAIAEFEKRLAAYIEVHQKADAEVPSLKKTDDPKEIASREVALGDSIRAKRASARPGDIITPDAARIFRRFIKTDFQNRSPKERQVFLDEVPHSQPKVNQVYPSSWPLATFPATLLAVLPKLPDTVEYRLVSNALILRDVKGNIVVDFIRDVY
jgi:hypothetical protein